MTEVREALGRVVELMVDEPEAVSVDREVDDQGVLLKLSVAEEDLGKVIGRQGRTARALRTLLGAREARGADPHQLEILD